MADTRKQDTREKIELGGLIVKAGLRLEDRAFLLGVLVTAKERSSDSRLRDAMIEIGRKAFKE
jgi:hypothetical protein